MLKHRVIPCVLLKDWQLVKSIKFESYRTVGHPTSTARIYNSRNVDELIVLDIDASSGDEPINLELILDIAEECFMPLTIGGGINSIDNIYAVLNSGADKVSINTIALENTQFIAKAASTFGSQCIICSIDVKKEKGNYKVFNKKYGLIDIPPLELAQKYERCGAGELLITSVDNEGTTKGFDIELLRVFKNNLGIPIIFNGGMGRPEDAVSAMQNGADAVAGAYIFHFTQYTPMDIKEMLDINNISVRM